MGKYNPASTPNPSDTKEILNAETLKIFGDNIRRIRKEMGQTAIELSAFLGFSTTYVGMLERGERIPSITAMLRICRYFGESIDSMFTPTDSKTQMLEDEAQMVRVSGGKRRRLVRMLETFDDAELDYIMKCLKSLKMFTQRDRNDGAVGS